MKLHILYCKSFIFIKYKLGGITLIEAERLVSSRPFIMYSGTDVSGTVGGNPSVQSYCGLDYTAASRYRLDRPDHNQIFQFFGNILGSQNKLVYCLDKFADGPYNDVPYESRPFETLFPGATERQKEMLGWILANTFPAVSAAATFALAGVDPTAAPVLDNNDAYAAVQVSLWVLLEQIALDEVNFLECTSGETHPKSERLRITVLELLRLAGQFVDNETLPEISITHTEPCCGLTSFFSCCNNSTLPSDGSSPYLVFANCPNEVRTICGRLLIGPFRVSSSFAGQPTITVTPFCNCGEDYSVSFMDFCGNPISNPVIGQEFYIAIRTCKRFSCFTITASFTGNITRVITLEPQSTALNYQPIGTSFEDQSITLNAELCICVEYPASSESFVDNGRFGININNNNNNNNNSDSGNNNNGGNNNNDSSTSDNLGEKIYAAAYAKLGSRYWWGAQGPTYFDCSGLVYWSLKQAGVSGGRDTAAGYSRKWSAVSFANSKTGDLVCFGSPAYHIGIIVVNSDGSRSMVHAGGGDSSTHGDNPKAYVKVSSIEPGSYYYSRISTIRRVSK